MPLSEEEILLTMMNNQNDRDRKNNPESKGSFLGGLSLLFMIILLPLSFVFFSFLGIIIWLIIFIIYLFVIRHTGPSNSNSTKNVSKGPKYDVTVKKHEKNTVKSNPTMQVNSKIKNYDSENSKYNRHFKCSHCGREYTWELKQCPGCGQHKDYTRINNRINRCNSCGHQFQGALNQCPQCGKILQYTI